MAMHFHFSKNKKLSQCSPKASNSGKNHQKSFHPSKSLQTPPNLSKPSKSPKIFPHLSKSPKITRNFPKTPNPRPSHPKTTPRTPPEHPQTSPHPPQTHQNTSQILRNYPIRQISGQNLTPLSANSNTTFLEIGNQSGTTREPVTSRENPCTASKGTKMLVFAGFWHLFGRFLPLFAGFFPKTAKKMWKTMHF